ncbi:MAG TPA: M14 family zinc carboxypeptidase [Anaerolineales bacterium]|nr:M14 family zinc carboxypeptidase [Anaerolineales bacterium]
MKNHIGLFLIGIIVGGASMFFVLGFGQAPDSSHSDQRLLLTQTPGNLPQLIMLEPTNVLQESTQTPISATITTGPIPASTPITISSTPTSLNLLNEQRPEVIGYSLEGRPLQIYKFGSGERERMIVADIHGGDEWNTRTLANQLIKYLNQYPDVVPADNTLFILASLNPDGEARAHNKYGRLNHNGVDLNRNFPVNWLVDWERAECWNYLPSSGGSGPGSEAEVQVLINFIENHQIEALISYHSAALGIFPGGAPWDENSIRLAESIAQVSTYPFPPLDTGCTYSGTLPDYAVSKGIAAVDLELMDHIDTDFDQNLKVLNVLLNFAP